MRAVRPARSSGPMLERRLSLNFLCILVSTKVAIIKSVRLAYSSSRLPKLANEFALRDVM